MANPSEYTSPLDKLKRWMGGWSWMSVSSDSRNVLPLSCESKHVSISPTTSFSGVRLENLINERKAESGESMSIEDEIERSKVHWSQMTETIKDGIELAEVSNKEVFKSLQGHPTWGDFFRTFGDGGIHDFGELVVGDKFAEGGQAELYHARVTLKNPILRSKDQKMGVKYVLKVFKKGVFLQDLQKQWPQGIFRDYEELNECWKLGKHEAVKFTCDIICGTLLSDGRFGFLLVRETEDLRTFIDRKMKARIGVDSGPFPVKMAFDIIYRVARGMEWLHNLDIVHRDLKASNVLCTVFNKNSDKEWYNFFVADFECSIGVVGTGFFRAPEILQALKDRVVNKRPNVFTKASDVYSYGMVCYEILTGKLPFEGHPRYDFALVLNGQRPEVPLDVDEWVHDLLQRCWQFDPSARPTFGEILRLLEANSKVCRGLKQHFEEGEVLSWEEQVNSAPKYEYDS